MLYQLHEIQRQVLNRMSSWAEVNAQLFSNPYSPLAYMPFSKRMSAGYDLLHRLGKEYSKPEFGLSSTQIDGKTVNVIEERLIERPFCHLLHFKRDLDAAGLAERSADPQVLLVAPLSGHYATLLRDTVRALLPDHDVYITDWQDARMVPLSAGPFHLDDYVHYVMDFIAHLGPDVHLISVCQPTVPVLAAVSLLSTTQAAHLPRSMTMMGGPIDARLSPTSVNALAAKKPFAWFETNVIYTVPAKYPGYLRRVYPGFLQHAGFVAMNPDRHVQSHWDYYMHLLQGDGENAESHRSFYDEYNAVLDLPAEYYLDTIHTVFQHHLLPQGKWFVRGSRVAPEDIKTVALFTIEGELDDISGSGQTQAAHELCINIPKAHKQHLTVEGAGHYGIFSGRRWRTQIYPKIRDFIRAHEVVKKINLPKRASS